jgi:hypothetical protein
LSEASDDAHCLRCAQERSQVEQIATERFVDRGLRASPSGR